MDVVHAFSNCACLFTYLLLFWQFEPYDFYKQIMRSSRTEHETCDRGTKQRTVLFDIESDYSSWKTLNYNYSSLWISLRVVWNLQFPVVHKTWIVGNSWWLKIVLVAKPRSVTFRWRLRMCMNRNVSHRIKCCLFSALVKENFDLS